MITLLTMYLVLILWINLPILYLHRSLTHNRFTFHPAIVAIIKIMSWLSKPKYFADSPRVWVYRHQLHHRFSDTKDDPHSPYYAGAKNVILNRHRYFTDEEIMENTKHLFLPVTKLDKVLEKLPDGRVVLLVIFLLCFSWPGIVLWLLCIYSHFSQTIFNYIAHCWPGYINDKPLKHDRSRNLPGLGIIYLGEELHANHHTHPTRVNHAIKWWEIDLGYCFLKLLSFVGLVKFKSNKN